MYTKKKKERKDYSRLRRRADSWRAEGCFFRFCGLTFAAVVSGTTGESAVCALRALGFCCATGDTTIGLREVGEMVTVVVYA